MLCVKMILNTIYRATAPTHRKTKMGLPDVVDFDELVPVCPPIRFSEDGISVRVHRFWVQRSKFGGTDKIRAPDSSQPMLTLPKWCPTRTLLM